MRDFEIERGYTTQEAIEATERVRKYLRMWDPNYGKGASVKTLGSA